MCGILTNDFDNSNNTARRRNAKQFNKNGSEILKSKPPLEARAICFAFCSICFDLPFSVLALIVR
jgi:hypothetical protein